MSSFTAKRRFCAFSSVSIAAVALSMTTSAYAQDADADSDNRRLETITVTAQFKEETLQDAGLAIDAVSADTLANQGVTTAQDLAQLVPALSITNGGGIQSAVYMRGVGNRTTNTYIDPAITINYDGVALASSTSTALSAFYDIERVEVLKGPQGTLYGKNATGGVINVIPTKPKLGVTEGFMAGGLGNYNAIDASGGFNVPVGDIAAFRIAGSVNKRDGYNADGTNDLDQASVRGQFLIEPTDALSLRFAVDYTDVGGNGNATTPIGAYSPTYDYVESGVPAAEGSGTNTANGYRNTVLSAPGFGFLNDINSDELYVDAQLWGWNAELNLETGAGVLTVIPAYRKTEQDSRFIGPGFNFGWWQNTAEQTSLEARLAGNVGDMVDYVVGGFYLTEEQEGNNTFNQEFVLPLQDFTQEADSWAIFGEATWNLNDSTRLVTGVRYTDDQKEIDGQIDNFIVFCGGLPPNLITPPASFAQGCQIPGNLPHFPTLDTVEQAYDFLEGNGWSSARIPIPPGFLIPLDNGIGQILHATSTNDGSYNETATTYRASFEKDLFEDSLVYASYSKGYRGGGLEPNGNTYEPEYLDAFTVGMKNRFAGGTVQLNAEIFYWDYTDQQISYFQVNEQNVLENQTDNVGAATNQGFDVDLLWLAADNTLISGKVQYLDAEYEDLHFTTSPPRNNINCPSTVVGALDDGTPVFDFDCSGSQSIYSPEWTLQAGIEQTFPLEGGMQIVAGLNTTWVDDQVTGFNNLAHEVIESHTRTNVNIAVMPDDENWVLSFYARNLENEHRISSTQSPLLGVAMADFTIDMTYGMSFRYNFGG